MDLVQNYSRTAVLTINEIVNHIMDRTNNSPGFTKNDHINISEYYEAEYWSKKFGVTVEQLKSAIRAVGNSVSAVEKRLGKHLV